MDGFVGDCRTQNKHSIILFDFPLYLYMDCCAVCYTGPATADDTGKRIGKEMGFSAGFMGNGRSEKERQRE